MKHVAFPFLTLDDAMVQVSAWGLVDPDGNVGALGEYLPGWDYARDLRLTRTIGLAAAFRSENLGFSTGDIALRAVVRIGTGPGSIPRRSWPLSSSLLRPGSTVLIDETVTGALLSQRVRLETTIILVRTGEANSRFAPRLPGSILWRDSTDVRLEGESPRFPMEIVSFRERFAGRAESNALWHLHWRPGELHRDFGGSVRLFLNHDREEFVERFVAADPLTLQCTLSDVITQVLEHALRDEDLEEILEDCEPTSVAGHVSTWLELAFPGQDVPAVRNLLRSSPGHFHSAILAMADPGILEDGA